MNKIVLETKNLSKHFGGVKALDSVNLKIRNREVMAMIGPNGAGKTTFLNLVSGRIPPDTGRVIYNGEDITGLKENRVCSIGIARTFQVANLFPDLSVFENIWIAVQAKSGTCSPFKNLVKFKKIKDVVEETIILIGLEDKSNQKARQLSHGEQKLLDIGIALGSSPELVFMDEPTSGLTRYETKSFVRKLKNLSGSTDMLIVEHDMDFVSEIADTVIVLHEGKIISEGSPSEVLKDELVRRVYLTRGHTNNTANYVA